MSPANPHADRRAALLPLAKAVLHLSFVASPVANAIDSFREVGKALNKDARPPERALWEETFALAVADALPTSEVDVHADAADLAEPMAELLAEAFAVDAGFGEAELVDPTNFRVYAALRERFPHFVGRIYPTYDAETNAETLRTRLDVALRRALVRAWSADLARYQPIIDRVQGPIAEGFRRERMWQRHHEWVRAEYQDATVFSFDEEPQAVRLRDVYVPLRCAWHENVEADDEADPAAGGRGQLAGHRRRVHVDWLHGTVRKWLETKDDRDVLRLVAGGPGSGKSSFARAFATETIRDLAWRVVFVPLQRIRLRDDLLEDLRSFWHRAQNQKIGFEGPGDPLEWYGRGISPCLLVFDGLDELARSDKAAADVTRRFVTQLKEVLRDCRGRAALKALVLGRSVAVAEARREARLPASALLHVLPLRPPNKDDLRLSEYGQGAAGIEIVAQPGMVDGDNADQRPVYWAQWLAAHRLPSGPEPAGLTAESLSGLNAEPLLLHLLIISGYLEPERWEEAADNRNRVYEAIFRRAFERDRRERKGPAAHFADEQLFTLAECVGLASWAGGGRTITETEFKRLRAIHAAGELDDTAGKLVNAGLTKVIEFFGRAEFDEPSYELIHKSFGEYLIARALVAGAHRMIDDLRRRNREVVLHDWTKVAGLAEITPEILAFVRDEIRLMDPQGVQHARTQLAVLMSWTLREGIPAHKDAGDLSFRLVEARQRHAEGALLAVLNACALKIAEDDDGAAMIALDWPHQLSLRTLIERQRAGRLRFPLTEVFGYLAWYVTGTPDENVSWKRVHDLNSTDLVFFRFVGADLRGASLAGARLARANLSGAELRSARLGFADLGGAKLGRANLSAANMHRANLGGATLVDANLAGAELGEADLRGAVLGGADLRGAFLGDAHGLTQEQVESARGDGETRLPKGLARPAHWEA